MISGTTEQEEITKKIAEVKEKFTSKNKTKDELIDELKDLSDLYSIQGKELVEMRKKLRDTEGDLVILKDSVKVKNNTIDSLNREKQRLQATLDHAVKMEHKLDTIIEKLIVNR